MILINGKPDNRINVQDRGLQYGDGVFETIAFRNDIAEFLSAHLHRLTLGCERLKIQLDASALQQELNDLIAELSTDQVIKIIITRGEGGRGYRITADMQATRILSTHPMPVYPESNQQIGIQLFVCSHRLSINPALAGIKHMNRLEQVLARSEWQDEQFAEGLMFDTEGRLVEGTMSNVFLVDNGVLKTPKLDNAGICGIMREKIINLAVSLGIQCDMVDITQNDLLKADEMFVCNSLIGIWPVRMIPALQKTFTERQVTDVLLSALKGMDRK